MGELTMRSLCLIPALLLTVACDYQSPTTPAIVPAVLVEPAPAAVPERAPPALLLIELSLGRAEIMRGSGVSLIASPVTGSPTLPATYVWTFGDGQQETTHDAFAGHSYARSGNFDASVHVTDAIGRTARATRTITVSNPPRTPSSPAPAPPAAAELTVSLTCTPKPAGTADTPCNVTVSYNGATLPSAAVTRVDWDWGDGNEDSTPHPSNSHDYEVAGTYTVFAIVTATTKAGPKTTTVSKSIAVL
jgi:hypothetical protein